MLCIQYYCKVRYLIHSKLYATRHTSSTNADVQAAIVHDKLECWIVKGCLLLWMSTIETIMPALWKSRAVIVHLRCRHDVDVVREPNAFPTATSRVVCNEYDTHHHSLSWRFESLVEAIWKLG
jgi:hypothetical protein